jgi:alcohol dehydrogenase (NADP+)
VKWEANKCVYSHTPDRVDLGLSQTLSDLRLDYLDLYLMHWPVGQGPSEKKYSYDYLETWHAMQVLLASGRVRHIGISNFSPAQLEDLLKNSDVKPKVHQMELHPYLSQKNWVKEHEKLGIAVTAYSPLGNMNPTYGDRTQQTSSFNLYSNDHHHRLLIEEPVIKAIGSKRNCTAAQVVLAWGMSRGVSVIPKSKHEKYIKENFGAKDCELETGDLTEIEVFGREPKRFNNPSKGWGVELFEGLDDA